MYLKSRILCVIYVAVSAQPRPVSGLGSINSGTNVATQSETELVTECQRSNISEGDMGELVTSSTSYEPSVSQDASEDCYDMSANPRGNLLSLLYAVVDSVFTIESLMPETTFILSDCFVNYLNRMWPK